MNKYDNFAVSYTDYLKEFANPKLIQILKLFSQQKKHKTKLTDFLTVEVVTDLDSCRELWNEFSPQKSLFDTWEFRFAFWQSYRHSLYFILLKSGIENLGVLPLWYETAKDKYFWFGSWWQEDNSFFVKEERFLPYLLCLIPDRVHLNGINSRQLNGKILEIFPFEQDDAKYTLDLEHINSLADYLSGLKKKLRQNLRRDKKRIESLGAKIVINNFAHFKNLVELNKQRCREKGDISDFEDKRHESVFRHILNLGKKGDIFESRMISVLVKEQVAAVDLIVIYNGVYYSLLGGNDVRKFSGIGNFINLVEIEDAINLGLKKIDFLVENQNWKNKWFKKTTLLKYEKKAG